MNMDNETFDRLPDEQKIEAVLDLASSLFGRERVRKLYDRLAPVVKDGVGHGQDYEDPRDNYWGGVWQVYRAE